MEEAEEEGERGGGREKRGDCEMEVCGTWQGGGGERKEVRVREVSG